MAGAFYFVAGSGTFRVSEKVNIFLGEKCIKIPPVSQKIKIF
jgi:hypothetical protein